MSSDEPDDRPISIASLRSKFENLSSNSTPTATVRSGAQRGQREGNAATKGDERLARDRKGQTGKDARVEDEVPKTDKLVPVLHLAEQLPIVSSTPAVHSTQVDRTAPTRSKPPAPPKPSKLSSQKAIPITTARDGSKPVHAADPSDSAPRRTITIPDSADTRTTGAGRLEDGRTEFNVVDDPGRANAEDGPTEPPSVKALLQRYGGTSASSLYENASAGPSSLYKKPSPAVQPSTAPLAASSSGSSTPLTAIGSRPPSIRRTSVDGSTTNPLSLPPPPSSSNTADPHTNINLSASPESTPILAPVPRSLADISRSPSPAPTPLIASRIPSPKPPQPNRASKPSHPATASRSVTPIPGPVVDEERKEIQSIFNVVPPTPPPSAPPSLPVRRDSASTPASASQSAGPPPIPPNRPKLASVASAIVAVQALSSPPKLPARSRGPSLGNKDAPKLPSRVGTLPPIGSPKSILDKDVGRPRGHTVAHPSQAGPSGDSDDYHPPPPPTRNVAPGSTIPIPPRRQDTRSAPPLHDGDSEDDDDADEPTHAPGVTSAAKRMLEEAPDSTHANRRPPAFVPDIKISGTAHSTSFTMHGRHVCMGSHVVRVYDTLISDRPIHDVDLHQTGLEFRIKDNRVTAMCFRPAAFHSEEGRYLWCGTKDGHLWELDIKTGEITDTRPNIHSSAVIHIFRYKNTIMSLEESGKLHVFEVGVRADGLEEIAKIPILSRTVRISEKFNFAKLICGKLWTSSGPASRSTTTAAASKGPAIRVYDPCSPSANTTSKTAWATEWTGAVTCATILPLQPGTVYLGHEGGYISIWNAEDLTCERVLKISTSDILALEGVGERLWAGNRKGQIRTYDVSTSPWRTTNLWTAHPSEHSVQQLAIDPWSIEQTGRFICWSLGKDALRAWDGLLSVDWIDCQMTARQADYSDFRDIRALICSWNIDSARPTDLVGSEDNSNFLSDLLGTVDEPEVIVFGFQEVIPLTDKKLTAKTLLFGSKGKDHSGSSGDKVSHAYRQWTDKLTSAVRMAYSSTTYIKIQSESLVGLYTCVFVKASERDALRDVDVCTVKRGIGGIYGNKGAIVARMVLDDTSICFINVHLAAGQSAKASRTVDLGVIMEDKAILPVTDSLPFINGGDGAAILDHELVILNGDLNYRIDQRREIVLSSIQAGQLEYLLEHDQLKKEMQSNHAFRLRSFEEAPITFKPTYKYNSGSLEYDSSEKRRIPAWCDRILFTKTPRLKSLHYRRYEPTVSDHRPISAAFKMQIKSVNPTQMEAVRKDVRSQWAKREAEMLQKMEEAYLGMV